MAASEIKRGDFVYRDTFFAEVADNHRHPRASAADLKDLLLPKKGSALPKDQVARWYEAQLLHYGLPRSKDKNTAKVRLTTALISDALRVPPAITQLEADMKKEFAANARKAKAAEKKGQATKKPEPAVGKGTKRKADDSSSTTKVVVKVGEVTFEIDHQAGAASGAKGKKAKTEPTPPKKTASKSKAVGSTPPKKTVSKSKAVESTPPKPAKAAKTNPTPTKATASVPAKSKATNARSAPATKSVTKPAPASPPRRKLQTAKRSRPFSYGSQSTRSPVQGPPQVTDHTPASFYDSDGDIEMEESGPPPYDSHDFSHGDESPSGNESSSSTEVDTISGEYHISFDEFSLGGRMQLAVDKAAHQIWGRFGLGHKFGIIRLDNLSDAVDGETTSFSWRAEDSDDGRLKFGRGCDGKIRFDDNGQVYGTFFGLLDGMDVEFVMGLEVSADGPDLQRVRADWDQYPRRAYSRA